MKTVKLPRIFPGWWVVVTGSFFNLWGAGFQLYGFSAMFKPLSAELGFNRAVTSMASSIGRLGGGIESSVVGWLTDRFGPRWVILFGVFLFGLGMMLMYFIQALWSFYLVWGVIVGVGMGATVGIAITTAIANWFVKKRALAMGLRVTLSAALTLPLVTWLISMVGWRMTLVIGGLVMWLVGFPLTWFCVKPHRPEYYGLLPDGAKAEEKVVAASQMIVKGVKYAEEVEEIEFTLRQTLRTPAYWLLMTAQITQGVTAQSLMVHFVPFLTDMGMSPAKAAATVTLTSFASMASRFLSGLFTDRVRKQHLRFVLGVVFLLHATGIIIFVLNQTVAMVYPFFLLHFLALGVAMVVAPVIGGRYFGRKAYGSITGSSAIFTMPFGILAPVYLGWIYDVTGSYIIAFISVAALLVLASGLMFLARPPKPPAVITDVRQIV